MAVDSPIGPLNSNEGGGDADVEEEALRCFAIPHARGNYHVPSDHKSLLTVRLDPEQSTN